MSDNKLTYYILTDKDHQHLPVHHEKSGIPLEDMHVVINSLDNHFVNVASHYCSKMGIKYTVTESNGTPSKGKNSVLDIFNESDSDYAVMIDGDDFLTPHGVNVYNEIAQMVNAPDVVCLSNQLGFLKANPKDDLTQIVYTHFPHSGWVDSILAADNTNKWLKWYVYTYFYVNNKAIMNRVVMISKKACQYRFDEEMEVGEDTMQFLLLKDAHFRGELQAIQIDDEIPTYIYDQTKYGVLQNRWAREKEGKESGSWVNLMVEKFEEYKDRGILHTTPLPLMKFDFADDYIPDICGIEGPDLEIIINKYIK